MTMESYSDYAEKHLRDSATSVADGLEELAARVRRIAKGPAERIASEVTHEVSWGMANLHLSKVVDKNDAWRTAAAQGVSHHAQ